MSLVLTATFGALLLISASAFANDTSLGGRGAVPYPIDNKQVAMVEEHVVLRVTDNGWSGDVDTHVTFVFENQREGGERGKACRSLGRGDRMPGMQ